MKDGIEASSILQACKILNFISFGEAIVYSIRIKAEKYELAYIIIIPICKANGQNRDVGWYSMIIMEDSTSTKSDKIIL